MWHRRLLVALYVALCLTGPVMSSNANVPTGPCSAWIPVNDSAFGMDTGGDADYSHEEGFEVATFNGQLYVGMEADNVYGARLWRTKAGVLTPTAQTDWEEVAADAHGCPFGNPITAQDDHIDSLAAFDGKLFASTANRTGENLGARVYASPTGAPGTWISAAAPGFGDVDNVNFKDMILFSVDGTDWLCGGTMNATTGAQIWCTSDGATWTQRNDGGFGTASNSLIASTGIFGSALYASVANVDGGSVWRTTDLVAWTRVFTATEHPRVEVAGGFGGHLYIAAGAYDGRNGDDPAMRLYRSPTGDPGSWSETGQSISSDAHNTRTVVDGATVYNGALYISTMNTTTGAEVWRTADGDTWMQANTGGFGDANTFATQLIPFNGGLYAWTSNYAAGQRVYRTHCVWPHRVWLPFTIR